MPAAARMGDPHTCPLATPGTPPVPHKGGPIFPLGCPTVCVGGRGAARVGDKAQCNGPPDLISLGSPTVYLGGNMAARKGDLTAHGGTITAGEPTVQIGGPAVSVTTSGGMMTVTWGAMTIRGAPADVAFFLRMLGEEAARSATMRRRLVINTTDTANPTSFKLGRNLRDPNGATVFVDVFNGRGNQVVDLNEFDNGEFPESPPPGYPDACTRGENLIHALDEAHQGAVQQNTLGPDPAGQNWYGPSHTHAIREGNQYRADRGQTSNRVRSIFGPGPGQATFKHDNGSAEVHAISSGRVTRTGPSSTIP
jgi:uncharacterized Zn-binding protein involved in type VI secretion